jgi:hypothetical protein
MKDEGGSVKEVSSIAIVMKIFVLVTLFWKLHKGLRQLVMKTIVKNEK